MNSKRKDCLSHLKFNVEAKRINLCAEFEREESSVPHSVCVALIIKSTKNNSRQRLSIQIS